MSFWCHQALLPIPLLWPLPASASSFDWNGWQRRGVKLEEVDQTHSCDDITFCLSKIAILHIDLSTDLYTICCCLTMAGNMDQWQMTVRWHQFGPQAFYRSYTVDSHNKISQTFSWQWLIVETFFEARAARAPKIKMEPEKCSRKRNTASTKSTLDGGFTCF